MYTKLKEEDNELKSKKEISSNLNHKVDDEEEGEIDINSKLDDEEEGEIDINSKLDDKKDTISNNKEFNLDNYKVNDISEDEINADKYVDITNDLLAHMNTEVKPDDDIIDSVENVSFSSIQHQTTGKKIGGKSQDTKAIERPFTTYKSSLSDINEARKRGRISNTRAVLAGLSTTVTSISEVALVSMPMAIGKGMHNGFNMLAKTCFKSSKGFGRLILFPVGAVLKLFSFLGKCIKLLSSITGYFTNKLKRFAAGNTPKTPKEIEKERKIIQDKLTQANSFLNKAKENMKQSKIDIAEFLGNKDIKVNDCTYKELKKIDKKQFTKDEKKEFKKLLNVMSKCEKELKTVKKKIKNIYELAFKLDDYLDREALNHSGNENEYEFKRNETKDRIQDIKNDASQKIKDLQDKKEEQGKEKTEQDKGGEQYVETGNEGTNISSLLNIVTKTDNIDNCNIKQKRDNNSKTGPSI